MNLDFDEEFGGEDWDDHQLEQSFCNFRNDRYSNAYGDYRGGYGPMNNGGFGPMNNGGFGPMDGGGFRPMNMGCFGPPNNMYPGNFGPGPRPLFVPEVPYMMGRGFGPQGPNKYRRNNAEYKTLRYLTRCGVPKENLKNLPKSLLQLMEPESCGICGQNFNSFAISRIHYVSKNHLKNQKKWLTQQSDAGFQQNREIPFKSRELYCELCDVHITSKVHADSHYAGRPHRAIVDGRKMPRNPALLQQSMAVRLEQLIRREKKNLKAADDADNKEAETVKEQRTFQSELFCEICKTSVTCTEQMTMHLNGKRHLSKEKHHILKMMKGEPDDDESKGMEHDFDKGNVIVKKEYKEEGGNDANIDENPATSSWAGDHSGQEANESQEHGNYDWGNGSGTWDEPEIADTV